MAFASFDDIVGRIEQLAAPSLIGIDGLPCSGKSTLAERLEQHFGIETIYLDDFVLPDSQWPRPVSPEFPFPYIRYAEFVRTVQTLASKGDVSFHRFDWASMGASKTPRTVRLDKHVIVEGVSALNASLTQLYSLGIFVESDRCTTIEAAIARGVGDWAEQWRSLFMPSADIYMQTDPIGRADMVFAGRGAEGIQRLAEGVVSGSLGPEHKKQKARTRRWNSSRA
ncbi:MAG: hypothetical protein ABIQ30_08415 [Devosia sp.]